MPAPDPAMSAQVEAHLEACAPCRGEFEALVEVDRRMERLAEARRRVAADAWKTRLERLLHEQLGVQSQGLGFSPEPPRGAKTDKKQKAARSLPQALAALPSRIPVLSQVKMAAPLAEKRRRRQPIELALGGLALLIFAALLWKLLPFRH